MEAGGALASVASRPGETVAVLAVAALYVALILVLPWRALTRTGRRTTATVLALVGVTALGVTTAVALAEDPAFSLVSFVQSPVLIAAGATAAALLALFGALRSIEQQREAAVAREAAESNREDRRIVLDSEIAEVNAGLQWTSQFSAACRGVLDASDPVEIATTLAIVDVLIDQAPNSALGEWAAGGSARLRAPARQTMGGVVTLSGSGTLAAEGVSGLPRDQESGGDAPATTDVRGGGDGARAVRPRRQRRKHWWTPRIAG